LYRWFCERGYSCADECSFWLPMKDNEFPDVKNEVHAVFKTIGECETHLAKKQLKEYTIYRFIDNGAKAGFYQCQYQEVIREQNRL